MQDQRALMSPPSEPSVRATPLRLSATLLRHIAAEIETGNIYWAALLLNEYLDQDDPLRRAFQRRIDDRQRTISKSPQAREIMTALENGKKLADFGEADRCVIREMRLRHGVGARAPFIVPRARFFGHRRITADRRCGPIRTRMFLGADRRRTAAGNRLIEFK